MTPRDAQDLANGLVFTGERFIPHQTDPLLALEHYHRYYLASRFADQKKVLDFACGEGYGSAFLSRYAQSVTAIDIDERTIDHARKKYCSCPNLNFEIGRCQDSPKQGEFDMAVSFELLEHLDTEAQAQFLQNVRRVLKQDGLFIVSSPEKNEYAETYQSPNEYHKHEMTLPELTAFLGKYFKHVSVCAQRVLTFSAMWRQEDWNAAQFRFHARKDLIEKIPAGESFALPLYAVAICSNAPIQSELLTETNSVYLDLTNSDQTKQFSRWARQMDSEALQNRDLIAQLQKQIEERTAWALDLDRQIKGQNESIEGMRQELEARTKWACSLESEVATERKHANELQRKFENISHDLGRITTTSLYRLLAKFRMLPNIWEK